MIYHLVLDISSLKAELTRKLKTEELGLKTERMGEIYG